MTLHWHRELEIVRVLSGTLFLYVNNFKYELNKGDIAFIGSRDMHRAEPMDAVYECVVFDLNMLSRHGAGRISAYVLPLLSENTFSKVLADRSGELARTVDACFDCMRDEGSFYEIQAFSLTAQIVYLLYKEKMVEGEKKSNHAIHKRQMISALIKWIEKNHTDKITLTELAAVVNINEKYLCRFFKQYTGKSPMDYVNHLRVERAAEKLADGMSVTEAALSSGFCDMSYFSKIFKRDKGVAPREYRTAKSEASK